MKSISEAKRKALEKLGMHPELMVCPATGRVLTVISSVHEYVKDGKTMNLLHIWASEDFSELWRRMERLDWMS